MRIQRLSTASYKFFSPGGSVVLVDPWLTNDPFWPLSEKTPEKLKEIDVVAITHSHFDHASGVKEISVQNEKAVVIAQAEYSFTLQRRGVKNTIPTNFGATVLLQGMKFSMVPASHTSMEMNRDGKAEVIGIPAGYVIEFENAQKVYVSGDTGLTADMKFVVSDYHRPHISILPVTGGLVMEPEQAAYAANIIGSRYVIPTHDFPREVNGVADPGAYKAFLKWNPVLDSYKKVDTFMEIMKRNYPHIEVVYIPIGGTVDIG
jgi:L-ascorbate metabolism protein UlaG (beta-lactamase superfamily)